ncbi:MAG: hypothetical protein ABJL72_12190 [Roseobacter sp.]
MIEGPDEWAVYLDPQAFGEPFTYQAQGQMPVEIPGIFTAAYALAAQSFATTAPVIAISEAALPSPPRAGDLVTLQRNHAGFPAGTQLLVADPQSDGTGLIRLILERK